MIASLGDLPRHHYTLTEYFALDAVSEARHEYWDGEIICVNGGLREHAIISSNIHLLLSLQVRGQGGRAFTGVARVKTPLLPPYRYPDVSVVCGTPIFEKVDRFDVLINPIMVIEVLSPTSVSVDRHEKREAYQALPSVMEYLIIAQDHPHITQFVRQAGGWQRHDYGDLAAVINLPSIECTLALRDVYDGVDFN